MTSPALPSISWLVAASVIAGAPSPSSAQTPDGAPGSELEALRARVEQLEREIRQSREPGDAVAETSGGESPFADGSGSETPAPLRGVYDKPFLATLARQAQFGGYTELEYHSFEDGILGIPEGFRMRRTNLFFFAEVLDRVRFGSEIEFETEFEGGDPSSDIEVAVEMAFIDWMLFEEFSIRGGALLVPLGRVNVNHDGPIRELTERPLVSTFVIPTTLTEAGVGAHGKLAPNEDLVFGYEAYAVNGFNLLSEDGELVVDPTEQEQLLREGRTTLGGDNNGGLASTGRLSARILRRFEVGGSWHVGTYDERGDNLLSIVAGDAAYSRDIAGVRLGLEGEIATAEFERDDFATAAGVPERFWGFYAQASVGGMPEVFRSIPYVFDGEGSLFTLVLRYDWVDLDGDLGDIIEPGITFRPVADTVFKFSYKFTQRSIGVRNVPGRTGFEDDGFVFSMSTYF